MTQYFSRPTSDRHSLEKFFNCHPQQKPKNRSLQRLFSCNDGTGRKWLTYCEDNHTLYCTVCLAFARPDETSPFITGMKDWKHITQRVEEHERSQMHRMCAEAYALRECKADISTLLHGPQVLSHRDQIRKRRQVLERVIAVVKVIGKRGLSYRGRQFEAAYTLDDMNIDHGTFLELIILLGKYDVCMKEHLSECIEKSKKMHETHSRGRGSTVTFLSKTTINMVISAVQHLIQEVIAKEVTEAGMFSVQIDTTQDITSQEQCSIVLRYVKDTVQERLLAVVKCEATTGHYFVQMLAEVMEKCNVDISNGISNATDGASNMQGQYRGFATLLSSKAPNQVHVWCYAHGLNLVLADTTEVSITSGSLFSLLNDIANFFRESYQRMNVWEQASQDSRHRRLSIIGETRWWAKDVALKKIFGSFGKPEQCVYIDVLQALEIIESKENLKTSVRVKARGYLESLMRYETVLTAQLFLRIFEVTTPLSKYLQTHGLDILSAHRMVLATEQSLRNMARDFESVKQAADYFVQFANAKLSDEECDLEVEAMLPEKRAKKKKKMPGEMADDATFTSASSAYEANVHNAIMDTVTETLHRRFLSHGALYADLALLDPRNFSEVSSSGLPDTALTELSKCLLKFDNRATTAALQSELKNLAAQWPRLKQSVLEEYTVRRAEDDPDEVEEVEIVKSICKSCKDCPKCCYQILSRYNLLTDAYHLLGLGYKFLLTLPVTQVACERSFSILKYIKNRLRSRIVQERLEAFMLMATEKDILMSLDSDTVIDRVAENSDLLKKLLLPQH